LDPQPPSLRLPEPDQSESDEIEARLEPDDAVAAELFDPYELIELLDPSELIELFDPNEPTDMLEECDSDELIELVDVTESSEPRRLD